VYLQPLWPSSLRINYEASRITHATSPPAGQKFSTLNEVQCFTNVCLKLHWDAKLKYRWALQHPPDEMYNCRWGHGNNFGTMTFLTVSESVGLEPETKNTQQQQQQLTSGI